MSDNSGAIMIIAALRPRMPLSRTNFVFFMESDFLYCMFPTFVCSQVALLCLESPFNTSDYLVQIDWYRNVTEPRAENQLRNGLVHVRN